MPPTRDPWSIATRCALLLLAPVLFAGAAKAQEQAPVWNTTGLDNPESVVIDSKSGTLYVSNVMGDLTAKDGNGYIAKLSLDGKIIEQKWLVGLDGPKGLALHGGRLYVADIDKLVEIDIAGRKIANTYPAKGAKFFNDVVASSDDVIYVSDTGTDTIWALKEGKFEVWLQSPELNGPNGLWLVGDEMVVAQWGKDAAGGKPAVKGRLLRISLADKKLSPWQAGGPEGNLDGISADSSGKLLVTSFMEGALYAVPPTGPAVKLFSLQQSTADLAFSAEKDLAIIPFLMKGNIAAYRLPH